MDDSSSGAGVAYFTSIDYSLLTGLLAISVAIGLYFGFTSRKDQSAEEYLQGCRTIRPLPIAFSLIASIISPTTITATPAEIYTFGWLYFLLIPALLLVVLASSVLFLPVFYENGFVNIYAYLEMRFCKGVRNILSVIFVLNGLLYIPIILYLPSLAFSEVSGYNVHVVNAIVCYCCVFYTLLGGIKAVVWTDVVQGFVMVLSLVMVVYFGTQRVGGLNEVFSRAVTGKRIYWPDFSLDLMQRHTFWNMFLGNFVLWMWIICLDQKYVQRVVAMPTLADARRALSYFVVGLVLFMTVNMFTGIIMYAYYHGCDPVAAKIVSKTDQLVPRFVQDVIGGMSGMPGVFISSIFSASLSTVSTTLNAQAGVIYMDFIRPLNIITHTDRNSNYSMKLIILIIGTWSVLGGIIIERLGSIFQAVYTLSGMCAGSVFGIFSLGMLNPWANKHGALYGLLIGMATICCIIINTQIAIGKGELNYEKLPTLIDGCAGGPMTSLDRVSLRNETTIQDEGFAFYKIAFMWYGPLGLLVTWTSGVLISILTGGQDLNRLDPNLLSPCIRHLLPKKYRHVQLQSISEKSSVTPNKMSTNSSETEAPLTLESE